MPSFKLSKPKKRNVVDRSGRSRTRVGGVVRGDRTAGTYVTGATKQSKKPKGKGYR
jgi:hypothetical protein